MTPRPLLRRRLRTLLDGDAASVADRVRPGDAGRPELVKVMRRRVARDPGVVELRLAEQVLEDTEVVAELRATVRTARPELLYPLVPRFAPLRSKHHPAAMRELLAEVVQTTDATGVDLDLVLDLANQIASSISHQQAVDYVLTHAEEAEPAPHSVFPRVGELLDLLAPGAEGWASRLEAWMVHPGDPAAAFAMAISLKHRGALALLAPRVDPDDLTEAQRSRAAQHLWRTGEAEPALALARTVPPGRSVARRRAQQVLAENDSFAMMDDDWRPPPAQPRSWSPAPGAVLHVLQNSLPYRVTGSASRTQGLLAGITRAGYDVTALTPPGFPFDDVDDATDVRETNVIDGVTYRHLIERRTILPRFPVLEYVDAYAAAITERATIERSGLVHSASNSYNALSGLVAARALDLPSIYEVRGLYEESRRSKDAAYGQTRQYAFARHLETMAAQESDRVIAITEGLRTTLVERGVPEEKIALVPNGVDTARFTPLERDEALARHYGLGDAIVIGYIGSLTWYEGHDLLFEAFARVHARHPEVRLLLVGSGTSFNELARLRARLGLEKAIVMPGRIPFEQAEAHYSIIDVAPITRTSSPVTETVSPLKPFEAMAMARTVVSSDVAVMTEVITDDENGLLFTKDDVDSLERVLERLVTDPDLRRRLALEGRRWVEAERDWNRLAERVDAIYRDLGVAPRAGE